MLFAAITALFAATAAQAAAPSPVLIVATPKGSHVVGKTAAPVKLVEYISYTCPHCARSYQSGKASDDDLDGERLEAIRRLLDRLAGTGNLREVGWRCVLANWLCTQAETQAQLARRLGVSPAAVSKAVNGMRGEFGQCLQANGDADAEPKLIGPPLV